MIDYEISIVWDREDAEGIEKLGVRQCTIGQIRRNIEKFSIECEDSFSVIYL